MVRSLFMADDGWASLGIDAPLPGVIAPRDDDNRVAAALMLAAAEAGAAPVVTGIEQVNPERSGDGCDT